MTTDYPGGGEGTLERRGEGEKGGSGGLVKRGRRRGRGREIVRGLVRLSQGRDS